MKQELYLYAISLKNKNLANISIVCTWFLLLVFLIPLLLANTVLGLIILFSYFILYFLSKKEKERYDRDLVSVGLFLLFLGIEFFALTQIQYRVITPFIVILLSSLVIYEIAFFIKVKKKRYSNKTRNKSPWGYILSILFGGLGGVRAGRLMARSEHTDLTLWIAILCCSLLIVYSFTFFQKYIIHKIIN